MTNTTKPVTVLVSAAALALALTACGGGGHSARPANPSQSGVSNTDALGASGPAAGSQPSTGSSGGAVLTASTGSPNGTITTSGVGTVTGAPNTLTIGVGVSTTALHASTALAQNNVLAAAVQQALQRDGVAASDIQTTGLSLQPNYNPNPAGYQVYDEVTAKVRNLTKAGTVIDDALQPAGDAGRLDMVNLSIADTSPMMATARQQAVAAARTEAMQLAAADGQHLGALVSITDQTQPQYPVYNGGFAQASGAMASAAPVPIKGGTQQLTVNIVAVWALAP